MVIVQNATETQVLTELFKSSEQLQALEKALELEGLDHETEHALTQAALSSVNDKLNIVLDVLDRLGGVSNEA